MTDRARDRLFSTNPYAGLAPAQYPDDIQDDDADHPVVSAAIARLRPHNVLVVGSWKARCTINMAQQVRAMNLACEIVCVDMWPPSQENAAGATPYTAFLASILRRGLEDIITPLPMTSDNAAHALRHHGLAFDIACIGAAQEYGHARRALENYWPLLRDNGVLIANGYRTTPGTTQTVDDFVHRHGCAMQSHIGQCLLFKPGADSSLQIPG